MKDDILINEGDIIEDIIFIKTGVLTLEIIIDLDDPKNSVESHLELTAMDCFKSISNQKFTELINLNSMNTGFRPNFTQQVFKENFGNKKELKIILCCIIALVAILVWFFIFWFPHNEVGEPNIYDEVLIWSEEESAENVPTFEQDVMNDLESYFNTNNGYEEIEWEFWFIDTDNE